MSTLPGASSPASTLSLDTNESDDKPPYSFPNDADLCKRCWNFKWDPLERRPMNGGSCSSLFRSVEGGCYTCEILKRAIKGLYEIKRPSTTRFGFTVRKYGNDDDGNFYPELKIWEVGGSRTADGIDMYKIADLCPWAFFQVKHHVPSDTGSSTSLSWAQEQMKQCFSQHPGCGLESDIPLLPTRVLDVGSDLNSTSTLDNGTIKVVETRGTRGRYIALSHCWGDPALMTAKLTAHTLQEYQTGISLDSLPQTFRDAVIFARRMETQYIWIDSLCIIQRDYERDSPGNIALSLQDWTQEAAKMCSIYENSYLTLASASATACTSGLFSSPTTLEIEGNGIEGQYQIFARREINHLSSVFPLMKRGWVTQESLLSPRTLLFGESELLWQCREHKTCQCSASPSNKPGSFSGYMKLPKANQLRKCSTRSDLIKMWYNIVSDYSTTSLTYQTDRLTAIDGIVQYMRPLRNCEYLAGLWSDSLAFDLLWSIDHLGRKAKKTVQTDPPSTTRWSSETRLFPTWSWASIQGRVVWWWIEHLINDSPPEAILVNRVEEGPNDAGDQSPRSPAYELRLRGVLVPSTLEIVRIALNKHATYYPDYDNQEKDLRPDTPVFCLRVLKSDNKYHSLVLLCVDKDRRLYERIGLLAFRDGGNGHYRLPDYQEGLVSWPRRKVEGLPPWWEVSKGWISDETLIILV